MAMLVITPGFLPLLTCTTVRKQKIEVLRGSLEVSETWRTSWGESYGRWDWSFYWGKYGKMILYSPIFGHVKIWENMASFRDWSYGHSNCGPHFQSQLISNGVAAQRPWTPKWSRSKRRWLSRSSLPLPRTPSGCVVPAPRTSFCRTNAMVSAP